MSRGRLPAKNVNHLFSEDAEGAPQLEESLVPGSWPEPAKPASLSIPVFDPLGIAERLSNGRVRDPLRHLLRSIFDDHLD